MSGEKEDERCLGFFASEFPVFPHIIFVFPSVILQTFVRIHSVDVVIDTQEEVFNVIF